MFVVAILKRFKTILKKLLNPHAAYIINTNFKIINL